MFRCLAAKAAWWLGLALACVVNAAYATSALYETNCTSSSCHGVTTTSNPNTCIGCHYHAVHPTLFGSSAADVTQFNLTATTDKTSYTVGDTITVSIAGGNKPDPNWIRLRLYDANGTQLASCGRFEVGGCSYATKLTARAQAGMSQLRVGIFVNRYEKTNGATPVFAQTQGGQTLDSTSPANHTEERVTTNTFSVTEPAPAPAPAGGGAAASGGGGSFDVFVLLAALFGVGRVRRR